MEKPGEKESEEITEEIETGKKFTGTRNYGRRVKCV